MGQIVLGITEGKRAAQFMRLPSVRFYPGEYALGRDGVDNFPGYSKVAGVKGDGYHPAAWSAVLWLLAWRDSSCPCGLVNIQLSELAEPCLQLLWNLWP